MPELLEGGGVVGGAVVVGTEPPAVRLFRQALGEHGDLGSHHVGDLDAHVAEPAETDDRDRLAGAGAPVLERRVQRDAGAEQRRGHVEADAVGDGEHEVLVDDDVGGVATLGRSAVLADGVVGVDGALQAVLLFTCQAVVALATGVDHAADADTVSDGVLGDTGSYLLDNAGDLVARHEREDDVAPLPACGVDVGVADPA